MTRQQPSPVAWLALAALALTVGVAIGPVIGPDPSIPRHTDAMIAPDEPSEPEVFIVGSAIPRRIQTNTSLSARLVVENPSNETVRGQLDFYLYHEQREIVTDLVTLNQSFASGLRTVTVTFRPPTQPGTYTIHRDGGGEIGSVQVTRCSGGVA